MNLMINVWLFLFSWEAKFLTIVEDETKDFLRNSVSQWERERGFLYLLNIEKYYKMYWLCKYQY